MDKQTLIVEVEASQENISSLLTELEKRAEEGEFEIKAVTLRKE